jgi:hypothetical protein
LVINSALAVVTPEPGLTVAKPDLWNTGISLGADGPSSDARTNPTPSLPKSPATTGEERSPSFWQNYREDMAQALQGTLNLVADVVEGFPVAKAVLKLAATGVNKLEVCLLIDMLKTLLIYPSRQVGRMRQKQLTSLASFPAS